MIKDIIENNKYLNVKNNVINMGYRNGWSKDIYNLYQLLTEYRVSGSAETDTIGRCVTQYSVKIDDGVVSYTLISLVDSGD